MEWKEARILVTGGSGGYGRGIAAVLKEAGAELWITGRDPAKLEKTAAELGVHAIPADVTSGADWDRVMREIGDLDVLVNNAGSDGRIAPVAEQSDEEIIRTIETNLTGALLGCRRAAAVMMRRKRGTIINIASVCALYAWPAWSVYTAAKAGLAKFSHGLYTELRPWGIRVSCVYPSWGQTDFNHAAGIRGAAEDPQLAARCIPPEALGKLIRSILEQPDYLAIPDVTLQPVIQEISPM